MKPMIALIATAILIAAIVALALFFRESARTEPRSADEAVTLIKASAERLLARSTATDDCFVIITEKSTGKYVQFAGSSDEPLLLMLPSQSLSAEERSRAEAFFEPMGAQAAPAGDFIVNFDRDTAAASAAAAAVFREVYQFDEEIDFVLTER